MRYELKIALRYLRARRKDAFISITTIFTAVGVMIGVAAYPVENCVDIHQDDNLEAFGFWHWLEHKEMGPSPYEGLEHRMSRTPGTLRSAAPILGQDNDEVFREMLSLSADEIEQLKKENVIF